MHPNVIRVASVLRELGVAGEVRELPEPAPTAATAAAQLGCEVGAIANSLVFNGDSEPLLIMTSGAHRVDTRRIAALLGIGVKKVRRADPDFVIEVTGQLVGGVALEFRGFGCAGQVDRTFRAADSAFAVGDQRKQGRLAAHPARRAQFG